MNYINKIYIGRKGSYWENSIIKVISNMTNNAVMCKIILDKTFKKGEETIFYKSSIKERFIELKNTELIEYLYD